MIINDLLYLEQIEENSAPTVEGGWYGHYKKYDWGKDDYGKKDDYWGKDDYWKKGYYGKGKWGKDKWGKYGKKSSWYCGYYY